MSNTNNYNIPHLEPNQTQKEDVYNDGMNIIDEELNNLDNRTTALEQGGGSGSGYDDTELRTRIEQNETDIDSLQNSDIQITEDLNEIDLSLTQSLEDISELKTFRISITNRVYNTEQKNIEQDNELDSIDSRVSSLEQGGGSGYDDSELRDLISDNSDRVSNLELITNSHTSSINNINSVNSNQNNTLSDHEDRILTLEEGFEPVDLTPLLNRLDDVESDVSTLYDNIGNLNTSFNNLNQNVNTFDNRIQTNEIDIDALKLSYTQQNTDIGNLDTRVTDLEQSSGGTSYDDTELRNRITQNESYIDALKLNDAQQDTDIDNLQTTTQDHETRITTLENSGGTGGGDMPQTGEIRKFSRAYIPTDWYELSKIRDLNTNNFYSNDFVRKDLDTLKISNVKHTSYNTYRLNSSTGNNNLSILTKDQGQVLINSDIGIGGSYDVNIFQNNPNNMYILEFNGGSFILLDYDLNSNNYTSYNIPFDNQDVSSSLEQNRRCTLVNKEHTFAYRLYTISNGLFIFKIDLINKTCDTAFFNATDISSAYNGGNWSHTDISLIYFNNIGNICFSKKTGGDGIILDTSTLTFTYSPVLVTGTSGIFSNISSSSSYFENLWIGDNQFIFNASNDRFIMIENYSNFKSEDLMNIDMNYIKNTLGVRYFYMILDKDRDLYFYNRGSVFNGIYNAIISNNKIDGTQSIESHEIVDCIYNIPQ